MSTRQVAQTVRIEGDRRVVERLHDGLVLALELGQAVVEHGPRVASTTRCTSGGAVDARPITNGPGGCDPIRMQREACASCASRSWHNGAGTAPHGHPSRPTSAYP